MPLLRTPRTIALEKGTDSKMFPADAAGLCKKCGLPTQEGQGCICNYKDNVGDSTIEKKAPSAGVKPFAL